MGPLPGMPGGGPHNGMGGPPPSGAPSVLANLTPEQRQQFQRLMTLSPEQVCSSSSSLCLLARAACDAAPYGSPLACRQTLMLDALVGHAPVAMGRLTCCRVAVLPWQLDGFPQNVKQQVLALQAEARGGRR